MMFSAYLRPGDAMSAKSGFDSSNAKVQTFFLAPSSALRDQQSKVGLSDESLMLDSPLSP